ncbi:MAG: hypothetical protein ACNS62_14930 [Candidatus Cyclobacteriaceae bacterium M3_2C_046]
MLYVLIQKNIPAFKILFEQSQKVDLKDQGMETPPPFNHNPFVNIFSKPSLYKYYLCQMVKRLALQCAHILSRVNQENALLAGLANPKNKFWQILLLNLLVNILTACHFSFI